LDIDGIHWLENYLSHSKQAYLVISHDRVFLDTVVTRIVEIEGEQAVSYPGNYSNYAQLKRERIVLLQKNFDLQQKEIQRLQRMSRRYRQWGQESDNEDFFRKAKEIERRIEKLKHALIKPPESGKNRLQQVTQANRSGKEVLVAEEIGKFVGDRLLFSDSTFMIYRQERLALTGANGSGKSTLIRCLLGETSLDEGTIRLGANVKIGYLPQKLFFANPKQRLLAYVQDVLPEEQKARRTLAQFGFFAEDVTKRIQDLSGGEQMRIYLLKLLQQKINFLILDEPTNHLDIAGKEELETILAAYEETILVVSHDRYFLRKVTDGQLAITDGSIRKHTLPVIQ
jgi:ATPase subunit of ABC transporter with duplicated ATPase domains